jgi:hypothetical protein
MNKQGTTEIGPVKKILLGLVIAVVIFSGLNNFLIGLSSTSLVRLISLNSGLGMRIVYCLMSLATLFIAVLLSIKVYVKGE